MDLTGDIAAGAAAVGLLLTGGGVIAQARQRKFALAQTYIARYWEIDDDLRLEMTRGVTDGPHRQRYLRLCEDEYEVARLGWIDYNVSKIWHDGIRSTVPRGSVQSGFARLALCTADGSHDADGCPGLVGVTRRRRLSWWIEQRLVW